APRDPEPCAPTLRPEWLGCRKHGPGRPESAIGPWARSWRCGRATCRRPNAREMSRATERLERTHLERNPMPPLDRAAPGRPGATRAAGTFPPGARRPRRLRLDTAR